MSLKHNGKGVIRLSDTTDHGCVVISAHKPTDMGRQIACVDDLVRCPKCHGVYPIVEGDDYCAIDGKRVALDSHKTACGARLISSV
ncbi:MAG: PAAR domain-containing protein [Deltaproteobacteria bacterium]|jgi:uncharacterized Zn-binding protein involved in type VI secretion|nr:PAAR domain-containing protein [Deltaproteobacteria bacterium]